MNGNSPRKLLNRISENSEINIKALPLILSPRSVLNSLWSFINNVFHIIMCRDGINHILIGMNIIPTNVLVQLIDKFIILVDGSNTENKFVIMLLTCPTVKIHEVPVFTPADLFPFERCHDFIGQLSAERIQTSRSDASPQMRYSTSYTTRSGQRPRY
jgi:hypothetical protein